MNLEGCRRSDRAFEIKSSIVIDANIIHFTSEAGDLLLKRSRSHLVSACVDGVKKVPDKGLFGKSGSEAIEGGMVSIRFKGAGVFGDANGDGLVAFGGVGFEDIVSEGVSFQKSHRKVSDGARASFAAFVGRKKSFEIAVVEVDHRFIERTPLLNAIAKVRSDGLDKTAKVFECVEALPSAFSVLFLPQPRRT